MEIFPDLEALLSVHVLYTALKIVLIIIAARVVIALLKKTATRL